MTNDSGVIESTSIVTVPTGEIEYGSQQNRIGSPVGEYIQMLLPYSHLSSSL